MPAVLIAIILLLEITCSRRPLEILQSASAGRSLVTDSDSFEPTASVGSLMRTVIRLGSGLPSAPTPAGGLPSTRRVSEASEEFASTGPENAISIVTPLPRSTWVGAQPCSLNGGVLKLCFQCSPEAGSSTPSRVSTLVSSTWYEVLNANARCGVNVRPEMAE